VVISYTCLFVFRIYTLIIYPSPFPKNTHTRTHARKDSGEFSLVGADNPGIVHTITSALAKAGLSIDRLETDQEIAPHGGSVLFKMRGVAIALAPLPKTFDIVKIKADLVELGDSLNCDVSMDDTVDESYQGSFYAG
jgi:glycine cleavage system regulatory protein